MLAQPHPGRGRGCLIRRRNLAVRRLAPAFIVLLLAPVLPAASALDQSAGPASARVEQAGSGEWETAVGLEPAPVQQQAPLGLGEGLSLPPVAEPQSGELSLSTAPFSELAAGPLRASGDATSLLEQAGKPQTLATLDGEPAAKTAERGLRLGQGWGVWGLNAATSLGQDLVREAQSKYNWAGWLLILTLCGPEYSGYYPSGYYNGGNGPSLVFTPATIDIVGDGSPAGTNPCGSDLVGGSGLSGNTDGPNGEKLDMWLDGAHDLLEAGHDVAATVGSADVSLDAARGSRTVASPAAPHGERPELAPETPVVALRLRASVAVPAAAVHGLPDQDQREEISLEEAPRGTIDPEARPGVVMAVEGAKLDHALPVPVSGVEAGPSAADDASNRVGASDDAVPAQAALLPPNFVALVAFIVAVLIAPFLHRLYSRDRLLAHALRQELYGMAGTDGGVTASEAARRLCISATTAAYHLRLLQGHGLLSAQPLGNRLVFCVNGSGNAGPRKARALLASPTARRLVEAIGASPDASLRALAARAGVTLSGAYWCINRLEREGLLRTERGPRRISYVLSPDTVAALDPPTVTAPALPPDGGVPA